MSPRPRWGSIACGHGWPSRPSWPSASETCGRMWLVRPGRLRIQGTHHLPAATWSGRRRSTKPSSWGLRRYFQNPVCAVWSSTNGPMNAPAVVRRTASLCITTRLNRSLRKWCCSVWPLLMISRTGTMNALSNLSARPSDGRSCVHCPLHAVRSPESLRHFFRW